MSDINDIKAVVSEWTNGLDSGDLGRMIATCDPDVVTCNNGQATLIGIDPVRNKYAPRIAAATIKSTFVYEHVQVFGDFAVVVGQFGGEMTDKKTGEVRHNEGRLVIGYRRAESGAWKMALDIDNNS